MAVDQTTLNILRSEQLTNVVTITSSATPAVNSDYASFVDITALAVPITSMTSGLTGTPVDGQSLTYRILDAGAQAMAWGSAFEAINGALPVLTVAGKHHLVQLRYRASSGKWGTTSVTVEP